MISIYGAPLLVYQLRCASPCGGASAGDSGLHVLEDFHGILGNNDHGKWKLVRDEACQVFIPHIHHNQTPPKDPCGRLVTVTVLLVTIYLSEHAHLVPTNVHKATI